MNIIISTILGILVFILVLGVIVLVHEGGHFLVAKKSGILCHEFAIGMGPLIAQKKKGETMFSIRAIPLGGYVAMAGEEIEFDILKGVKSVKLVIENDIVTLISFVLDNPRYKDLPTYDIVEHDLKGTKAALPNELYIVVKDEEGKEQRYTVARDCMVNIKKDEKIQNAPYDRLFVNKPLLNRFLSVFAGPLMNFVFAVVVFFLAGVIFGYADTSSTKIKSVSGAAQLAGLTDEDTLNKIGESTLTDWESIGDALSEEQLANNITSLGSVNVEYTTKNGESKSTTVYPLVVVYSCELILQNDYSKNPSGKAIIANFGQNMSETKAFKGGLRADDVIVQIDETPINNIKDVVTFFSSSKTNDASKLKFYVERSGETGLVTCEVESYSKAMLDTQDISRVQAQLGVSTGTTRNIGKILYMPFVQTKDAGLQIFKTLGLFFKKNAGVKITDLSGPVGIMNLFTRLVSGEDALYNILYWTGLLSVNIGLINLLPLPALDGGRLVFIAYEAITRKKPNAKVENTIHNIGFILLMGLFVVIFISDIVKCF